MAIKRIFSDYFFIILIALFGIAATLGLAWQEYQSTALITQANFSRDADERLDLLDNSMKNSMYILQSMVSFATNNTDEADFKNFANSLLKDYPYIESFVWVPRIKKSDRAEFEREAAMSYPGYRITELDKDRNFVRAPIRDEYFPVYHVQPLKNKDALGFNYASDELRGKAIEMARETHKIAGTAGVKFIITKRNGILLFAPVYNGDELSGFVVCVLPMQSIIDLPLQPLVPRGNSIIVHDITNNSTVLHVRPSRIAKLSAEDVITQYNAHNSISKTRIISFAGRSWGITVIPAPGYYNLKITRQVWTILLFGLAFTTFFVIYMLRRIDETSRITAEVTNRTHELSHTKRELELILNSTKEGVIGVDKNAIITFSNIMAPLMLGYKKTDIIGQSFYDLILRLEKTEMHRNTVVLALSQDTENKAVDNEVFYRRNSQPMKVEYTASSLIEDNLITGAVIVFRDIAERKLYEEQLEQKALYDQLTHLANRGHFVELLKNAIARAHRMETKIGVIFMDMNDFKPINDTHGHAAGDRVLQEFATRLKAGLREYDTVARFGGDEFAIIVDNVIDAGQCMIVAERLVRRLEEPYVIDNKKYNITSAIGIALYPDDAENLDELMVAADSAMYAAKKDKTKPYMFWKKNAAKKKTNKKPNPKLSPR